MIKGRGLSFSKPLGSRFKRCKGIQSVEFLSIVDLVITKEGACYGVHYRFKQLFRQRHSSANSEEKAFHVAVLSRAGLLLYIQLGGILIYGIRVRTWNMDASFQTLCVEWGSYTVHLPLGSPHPHSLSSALPAMTDIFYLGLNMFSSVAVLASD